MSEKRTNGTTLDALSRDIASISEHAGGGVVSLNTRDGFPTSGTIWEAGYVVTADHVLHREEGIRLTLADGSEVDAEVVGRDQATDLALLGAGVDAGAFVNSSADLKPGCLAVALSRNSERTLNASLAVVNAVGGEWRTPAGGLVDAYLRLDVSIYAGFSGGPLVDSDGMLIGINSSRLSRHSAVALPVSTVDRVVAELKEHGRIRRGYLGVATLSVAIDESVRDRLRLAEGGGLMVVQVEEGSGSQRAGILQGDILLELGGQPLRDPEELVALLGPETVGSTMKVRAIRGGAIAELEVQVGERPQRAHSSGRGRRYRGARRGQ